MDPTIAKQQRTGDLSRRPVLRGVVTSPRSAMTTKRKQRKPRTFTHAHRQRLDRAVSHYLDDECYPKKTAARVSEFAAFLKRNPEYLTRTTASIVGVTLREYLRRKQLEEAERLILTTPLPMHEIALHAGFGTTSTFYRCFKRAYGIPPGAFREVRK
jgi:AraC-like DNA-binding protein